MTTHLKLTMLCGFGLLALGCGSAPAAAPDTRAATAPPTDVSNLTFLLEPDRFGPPLSRRATIALRSAMEAAGYHVVVDPTFGFDAELLVRGFVWGQELDADPKNAGVIAMNDHVRFTLVAVAQGRIVALNHTYFNARNGDVYPDQLTPALVALSSSEKLQELSASVQREQRTALRATLERP